LISTASTDDVLISAAAIRVALRKRIGRGLIRGSLLRCAKSRVIAKGFKVVHVDPDEDGIDNSQKASLLIYQLQEIAARVMDTT